MTNENKKLSADKLYDLRRRVVKMRKRGYKIREVADAFDVGESTVKKWWAIYLDAGITALKPKKRGRKTGSHRSLTPEQEQEIQQLIALKTPDQLKLPFALWTRRAVMQLIHQHVGVRIAIRSTGRYLKRWGYTPQKPLKRAYEQNPKAVQRFLDEEYPEIKRRAKAEDAEIHWGDETGLRSDSQHGRSYSPKGKTPVIRLNARRWSSNLISTITNQGKVRFMLYKSNMNADVFIRFLKRLVKDATKKVFLILDNLRVHHSKIVKAWVEKYSKQIELFYLPSYSPQLNPDELLNCDLKAGVHSGPPARNEKQLKDKIKSHLFMLQKRPARVRKYFEHKEVRYAA